jgi:membrane fusion protein (multidrug efflux system)
MIVTRFRCLAFLAATTASATACKNKADASTPGTPTTAAVDSSKAASTLALPVVGEPVRKGDLVLTVSATGQIRTDATSSLKAEAAGTVLETLVRAGDHVARGQTLVRLDPKPLDLDVKVAEATVTAANVAYNTQVYTDSMVEGRIRPERRAFVRAQAGVDGALVQLEKAKLAREHATIAAPFDGVVESVSVAVGDHVGTGEDIATVVDMKNLRVEAQVLEHDLPLLKKGGEAWITIAAFPDKPVRGTIAAVLPLVDTVTRAGRVVIRITGDGTLRPGMYADVRLEANRLPDRILVPSRAIIERDNRPLVFVAKDGRAEWVYVNAGRSNGRDTEILADSASGQIPLKPGDMVITDGQITLSHQAPIKLTPKREGDQQ